MSQTWKKVLLTGSNTAQDIQGSSGTSGQVLTTNGSGTGALTWSDKTTNTNTTYSAGTNMSLSGTVFSSTDTNTVYTHPTTAGNVHLPSGGASNNFVKYSSAGTGTWSTPSWTIAGGNTTGIANGKSLTIAGAGGASISQANSSGNSTVTITTTDNNTTYSAGTNMSLSGTTFSSTDTNTTYTAGTNMSLSGTTFSSSYTNTTYSAGTNMSLSGTTFSSTNTTYSAGTNMSLSGTTFSSSYTNTNLLSGGTCSGNLDVTGTLTVGGSTTTLNTATLTVDDPFIVVADGGGNADGGITKDHTTAGSRGHMIFDHSEYRWVVSKGASPATTVDGTVGFNANVATIQVVAGTAPSGGASDGCGVGSFWLNTGNGSGDLYVRVGNVSGGS